MNPKRRWVTPNCSTCGKSEEVEIDNEDDFLEICHICLEETIDGNAFLLCMECWSIDGPRCKIHGYYPIVANTC